MEYFKQGLSLYEEVTNLICLRQEGSFWDFKKQWYTNKSDMLHDIICMSNNLSNRTAYIIIGIDEQQDYSSENMIIREDNLEALKVLLPQYEGRVKCIYIDIKTPRLIQFNFSSADFAA